MQEASPSNRPAFQEPGLCSLKFFPLRISYLWISQRGAEFVHSPAVPSSSPFLPTNRRPGAQSMPSISPIFIWLSSDVSFLRSPQPGLCCTSILPRVYSCYSWEDNPTRMAVFIYLIYHIDLRCFITAVPKTAVNFNHTCIFMYCIGRCIIRNGSLVS